MKKRACMAAVLAAAGILTACSGGQKESGEKVFQIGFTTAAVEMCIRDRETAASYTFYVRKM